MIDLVTARLKQNRLRIHLMRTNNNKSIMIKSFKISLFALLLGSAIALKAQQTKVYFGLGGLYNSFQDTRFSDVQFSKSTVLPELGFSRVSEKDFWHASAYFFFLNYDENV